MLLAKVLFTMPTTSFWRSDSTDHLAWLYSARYWARQDGRRGGEKGLPPCYQHGSGLCAKLNMSSRLCCSGH